MSGQGGCSVERVTTATFAKLKADGAPIVVATAYDTPSARLVDAAGVDAILVGDSLGMTVLGYESTLPVTMDDMLRAVAAVVRGASRTFIIADMPFMSYQAELADAMRNAGRFLAEGAHAVKIEGGNDDIRYTTATLVEAGIPVMGHLGLTPQSVHALGGYRTQGKTAEPAAALIEAAVGLQDAGAFSIVLECVPAELARIISELLEIPTIGIGAGDRCDGQVQVFHDLIGYGAGDRVPRHAKRYADVDAVIGDAIRGYVEEVRGRTFPTEAQSTHIDPEELAQAQVIFGAAGLGTEACEEPR
ncbi:MAG: 3-methyl-2-oxobutanoate hydroxymethyltransferase [Coriobacteriales bacterium]|nr:3-methyl-2-oxobutanoate hydroxymethyltransferase [Coriobacteriales bacterium]